jgi:hypothetical protein
MAARESPGSLAAVVLVVEVADAGIGVLTAPEGRGAVPADVERVAARPVLRNREGVDEDVLFGTGKMMPAPSCGMPLVRAPSGRRESTLPNLGAPDRSGEASY